MFSTPYRLSPPLHPHENAADVEVSLHVGKQREQRLAEQQGNLHQTHCFGLGHTLHRTLVRLDYFRLWDRS